MTPFRLVRVLILGVLANVAVAWVMAAVGTSNDSDALLVAAIELPWLNSLEQRLGVAPGQVGAHAGLGTQVITVHGRVVDGSHDGRAMAFLCQAGWPILALEGERIAYLTPGSSYAFTESRELGAVSFSDHVADNQASILPLRPMTVGFILNSVMFAVVLLLLRALPRSARSTLRRWRHLCPHCGYSVRDLAVCPECGRKASRPGT